MNREEIKQALDCCTFLCRCSQCPYESKSECSESVEFDALKLIESQEAEIAILKDESSDLIAEYKKKVLEDFVDKLEKKIRNYYPSTDSYCVATKAISLKDIYKTWREFE